MQCHFNINPNLSSVDRWEIIAGMMCRNVSEVTFMAYKLKDSIYQTPGVTEKVMETINRELKTKIKTKSSGVDAISAENSPGWTQEQQKALEAAIQKYPKRGTADDRWVKIANNVPGKTKDECQARYKYLFELLNKQKRAKEEENKEKQILDEKPEEVFEEPQVEENIANEEFSGGKKRNKRKEKKKNIDYYGDNCENSDSE